MKKLGKSILFLVSIALLSGMVSACNTAQGFGEDVQASGRAIEKAAR